MSVQNLPLPNEVSSTHSNSSGKNEESTANAYPPNLTKEETSMLHIAFHQSGGLRERKDVIALLRSLGQNLSSSELDECLRVVNFTEGTVMVQETFLNLMRHLKNKFEEKNRMTEAIEAFASLGGNDDRTGDVDVDRLRQAFKQFNLNLDIEALIRQYDNNESGHLQYDEFAAIFKHFHEPDSDESLNDEEEEEEESEDSLPPEVISRMQSMHRLGLKFRGATESMRKKMGKELPIFPIEGKVRTRRKSIAASVFREDSIFQPHLQATLKALLTKHEMKWKEADEISLTSEDIRPEVPHHDSKSQGSEDVAPYEDNLHLFSPSESIVFDGRGGPSPPSPNSNVCGKVNTNNNPRHKKGTIVASFNADYGVSDKPDPKKHYRDHTVTSITKISAVSGIPKDNEDIAKPPKPHNEPSQKRQPRRQQGETNSSKPRKRVPQKPIAEKGNTNAPSRRGQQTLKSSSTTDIVDASQSFPVLGRTHLSPRRVAKLERQNAGSDSEQTDSANEALLPALVKDRKWRSPIFHTSASTPPHNPIVEKLLECSFAAEKSESVQETDSCSTLTPKKKKHRKHVHKQRRHKVL